MEWTDILRCPRTGDSLHFDEAASSLRAEHSGTSYPIIDGIVDFCPRSHDRISASYDRVARRYDPYITSETIPMRVFGRIIWGTPGERDPMDEVLSLLPGRFEGVLLDVPVGTGVFTGPLYSRYPNAIVVGVDCSMKMLQKARDRFREQGVNNVHLLKADAANLPLRDAAVDMVLSMNGWHAFADKHRTTTEMRRVLRQDGKLIACGYIRGARRLSDWFVKYFGVRNGFFTPPFFLLNDMDRQFKDFAMVRKGSDKSIAWFDAVARRR